MSEQESAPNHEQILKNKQQAERKFGCPCGKWYLSYPALFTHVKQKHDGKPPGALIKPKTDKARGRPRLPTSNNQDDQSILAYDCQEELEKAIEGKSISYDDKFDSNENTQTCQGMASQFLKSFVLADEERKIVICFLNYIRFFVKKKYEDTYWDTHKPNDIIDISNEIVRDLENHKQAFPLDRETLVNLLFVLFRWMYKNKWTDHKLVRRTAQSQTSKGKS